MRLLPDRFGQPIAPHHSEPSGPLNLFLIFASLSGFLAHVQVARINPALLAVSAVATIAGAVLGAWLATERLNPGQLKQAIAVVLLLVAGWVLL